MSKWEKVKLKDAFELQMGKTPSRNNSAYWNDGANKWVSIADISSAGKYIFHTKETISKLGAKNSGIKIVPKETVIMSFKLSIGKTCIVSEDMYTNEAIMAFINKNIYEIDNDFLYYVLNSINWSIGTNKAVMGSTLNKTTLGEFEILLPPLETQKQIAKILDTASELLAMHKQQLDELDNLIKSVFYDMFGSPDISEKRWDFKEINDLCSDIVDCPHSTPVYCEYATEYPSIRTSEIKNGSIDWSTMKYVNETEYLKRIKRIKPYEDDIVYAREGSFGDAVILPKGYSFCLGQRVMLLRAKKDLCNYYYLWYVIRSDFVYNQAKQKNIGATVPHVNVGDIKKFMVPLPPMSMQSRFATIVTKIEAQKTFIKKSIEETQLLFDSLMSQYFDE